ncbi:hypothetical protein LSH36_13g25074 [Paralvinella palmiformis]|uniref:Peptidase S1 domain-containing protein n=1 Tax=Paralvinella palmiformis TaxID=53620 RepID=A0AAD9KD33_9ANNE|nr:hypothetical protein LSH36_13g25074 [Paralvinella palmiformis]
MAAIQVKDGMDTLKNSARPRITNRLLTYHSGMYRLIVAVLLTVASAQPPVWWPEGPCGMSPYPDAGDACPIGEPCVSPQIVGGIIARDNEFPWQVSVRDADGHKCGGVLLNDRWVISAATCTNGLNPGELIVVLGAINRTDPGSAYNTVAIFEHELYDASNYDNDLTLIKTTDNIAMSELVVPICAPDPSESYEGYDAEASGWGTLSSGGQTPDELRYTTLRTINNTLCQDLFPGNEVTSGMICAGDGGSYQDRDTCQGDAGGPLGWKNGQGQYVLIGLTSWGISCAAGYPGVYTRVSQFSNWITEKMEKN